MSGKYAPREKLEKKGALRSCVIVWSVFAVDARVKRYVDSLAELGFTVDVIALAHEKKGKLPYISRSKHITIYEISVRRKETTKLDYMLSFLKFFILSTYYVSRLQMRNKYAFVHVHTPPDFQVYSVWLPKIMGSKILLDIHDPMPDFYFSKFGANGNKRLIRFLELIERLSLRFTDHAITVTDYWKKVICKRSKIPEDKISVIVNLPDIRLFDAHKFPRTNKGEHFTVIYPGTVNKHCGLDVALKAISLVKEKIPSLRFKIYGKGTEYDKIKAMTKELSIDEVVSFHDFISLERVPAIMAEADVGIALLSGEGEYSRHALNVKLFEYLAIGLPAIATITPATQHYLNDQVVMFSKPNDPEDVARCILELYQNPCLRQSFSHNGLEFTQKFNWNVGKGDFFEIVNRLITKSGENNGIYKSVSTARKN